MKWACVRVLLRKMHDGESLGAEKKKDMEDSNM